MNKYVKKAIAVVTLAVLLSSLHNHTSDDKVSYETVIEEDVYYTNYSKGKVYIGNKEEIGRILDIITYEDIIVLDQRNSNKDPNMKIISSHRIDDAKVREEIIDILIRYEIDHPSNWKRTRSSMEREWFVHNLLYNLHVKRHRTRDVDLNNGDEKTYKFIK